MIEMIAAMSTNRVIGDDNKLPWRLPADLKYFKQSTLGKTILMGRKTYESIGKPLQKRTNLILTRNTAIVVPGCEVYHSLDSVLADHPDLMVIGGEQIYRLVLPFAQKLLLTHIKADIQGDAYFPILDGHWMVEDKLFRPKDEKNPFDLTFMVLQRIP